MEAAVGGASGFIGRALVNRMVSEGWTVRAIPREAYGLTDGECTDRYIRGTDLVVNLAGASIGRKWTPAYKKEILESRVKATSKIAKAIASLEVPPKLFISGSAVGIYDDEHTHDEGSTMFGTSFLSDVCRAWEEAARPAEGSTRVVLLRLGVVLGQNGGMLEEVYRPFSFGLGARIGNGRQPFSFIHLTDLVNAVLYLWENTTVSGPVNAVSPFPSTNGEFTALFGRVLNQMVFLSLPAFAVSAIFGERSEIMLKGQRVLPAKLHEAGFRFRYPTLTNTLTAIYR